MPAERLLIETDAPYLAPTPHRGRRNEPAFLADIASFVAAERGIDVDTLAQRTTGNFHALFARARTP